MSHIYVYKVYIYISLYIYSLYITELNISHFIYISYMYISAHSCIYIHIYLTTYISHYIYSLYIFPGTQPPTGPMLPPRLPAYRFNRFKPRGEMALLPPLHFCGRRVGDGLGSRENNR